MEETPIKKLLLQHLHRNQVKDKLVAIDEEIVFESKQLKKLRLELKEGTQKVNKLEGGKIGRALYGKRIAKRENVQSAKEEELYAYDSYEGKIVHVKSLQKEKEELIKTFSSLENVKEELDKLVVNKRAQLKHIPEFARQINILELKRKRLYKYKDEFIEVLQKVKEVKSKNKEIYIDLRPLNDTQKIGLEYYGAGHLSSYKKKKLIERTREKFSVLANLTTILKGDLLAIKFESQEELNFGNMNHFLDQILKANLTLGLFSRQLNTQLSRLSDIDDRLKEMINTINDKTNIIEIGNRGIDRELMFFIVDF